MKSGSTINARLSNEYFFQKFDVGTIKDHDSIEELALHYDNEVIRDADGNVVDTTLSHYMTEDRALDLASEELSYHSEPLEGLHY